MGFLKIIDASEHYVPIIDIKTPDDGNNSYVDSSKFLGCGFFFKPGWVMTCKHVIESACNQPGVPFHKVGQDIPVVHLFVEVICSKKTDLAIARIADESAKHFKCLELDTSSERILGTEIINFSFVEQPSLKHSINLVPRLFRGYIMRESLDPRFNNTRYLELNFPALLGMSGSPILNFETGKVLGVIYQNFRSQVMEDYHEVEELSDTAESIKETITSYKVVDFGMAIDLKEHYKDL